MLDILQSILAFIFALGILITFHEFGHYWVAKKCDVRILRFSIGFGKPLWRKIAGNDNTEFVIASIPLGGYVKMLDEREGPVREEEKHRAFNNKSLSKRIAVVIAGPLFNFLFAIAAYWLAFMIGITGMKPQIGEVIENSPAAVAGIDRGDEITAVDNVRTATWNSVIDSLVTRIVKGKTVDIRLQEKYRGEKSVRIDLNQISIDDMAEGDLLSRLGMIPARPVIPAVIGKTLEGGAAEVAGLQRKDRILTVNGEPMENWEQFVETIRNSAGLVLVVKILRENNETGIRLAPARKFLEDGSVIGYIGAAPDPDFDIDGAMLATESYSVVIALRKSLRKTVEMSLLTLRILGKMITGEASVKNLSGPISIAEYAGKTAQLGIVAFLGFLAIISISLGVLNLLPVPVLDGGHLFYYLVEAVKGSPLSESAQIAGQQVGIVLLLGLMSLAFYNDIVRLIQ